MPNTQTPSPHPQADWPALRPGRTLSSARTDMLRAMLPKTQEYLQSRHANLIGEDLIEDYVALDWMEWAGGGLRLTETGRNLCNMVSRRMSR